ncbi:MAG: class I SAM-dependent methyltransferase [Elusimicrobia bacterium]|nr:class I SAM-dependent methyltransferase [Elusimicrobiota bacterium]
MANSGTRIKQIKEHFEKEAKEFDKMFFKVAPHYIDVVDILVSAIPFEKNSRINVVDLGCGTGNITKALLKRYPNANVTCVDIAKSMLEMAKNKLKKYKNVKYWCVDITKFDYSPKYDVIISSLVLHHIEEKDKYKFYKKIYNSLKQNGVFYTADFVLGSNPHLQKMYLSRWEEFLRRNWNEQQIKAIFLKHKQEDRPCKLITELELLNKTGFKDVDAIWKQFNFAVYGGQK